MMGRGAMAGAPKATARLSRPIDVRVTYTIPSVSHALAGVAKTFAPTAEAAISIAARTWRSNLQANGGPAVPADAELVGLSV